MAVVVDADDGVAAVVAVAAVDAKPVAVGVPVGDKPLACAVVLVAG